VRQTNRYSSYVYDSRGNQTFADSSTSDSQDRTIRYTAKDQAYEIFKGTPAAPNRMARFWYAPDGSRYKREDTGLGIVGTRRTLYVGNLEIVSENGTTTYKRYIGGILVQNVVNGIAANRYTFTDHLGSIVAVANETGTIIEGGGFNAFGERRANDSATSITQTGYASTTRGYTGHEMLDGLDVIHMNGRIYDPTLGRFLQPDPIIQAPDNPQNWNAYSYVFNNPYKYTDPTGYLGQTERNWLGAIIAIAASVFTGGAAAGWWAASLTTGQLFAITVAAGFASGAITTKSFEGGLYGAFGAALSFGAAWATQGLGLGVQMFASALSGGIVESLQGGNFGAGFVTAWVGAAVAPGVAKIGNPVGRTLVAAIVGGTLSKITGGKFVNGAVSWAVQVMMRGADQQDRPGGMISGSAAEGASGEASVPEEVKVEASGFLTPADAARAMLTAYHQETLKRRQEPQSAIVKIGADNWGYLTPGWGPTDAVIVYTSKLAAAYKAAGYARGIPIHGHFDSNLNFSTTDFERVWGGGYQYMFNRKGELRGLGHGHLMTEFKKLHISDKKQGLRALQRKFPYGLPGDNL
jgi:RHS repeat-associated protein